MFTTLIDTCVAINFIKEVPETEKILFIIEKPSINYLVENELFKLAKNENEKLKIQQKLNKFFLLPSNDDIMKLSSKLVKLYGKSKNLNISNAIMAATALVYSVPLYTENLRNYHFIPKLNLFTP